MNESIPTREDNVSEGMANERYENFACSNQRPIPDDRKGPTSDVEEPVSLILDAHALCDDLVACVEVARGVEVDDRHAAGASTLMLELPIQQ